MTGTIACPLCGKPIEAQRALCRSCPVGPGCTVLCCPGCGYRFVERSAILEGLGRLWRWIRRRPA